MILTVEEPSSGSMIDDRFKLILSSYHTGLKTRVRHAIVIVEKMYILPSATQGQKERDLIWLKFMQKKKKPCGLLV